MNLSLLPYQSVLNADSSYYGLQPADPVISASAASLPSGLAGVTAQGAGTMALFAMAYHDV